MTDTCETCRFYRYPDCKRYPPQVRSMVNGGGKWAFPVMDRSMWCGEYQESQEAYEARTAAAEAEDRRLQELHKDCMRGPCTVGPQAECYWEIPF